MISSGPFALTLGQAVTVTAGATVGISFDAVILSNHSPMACAVDIGGPAKWLQPWSADLYPLPPGDSVAVTPRFTDQSGSTAGNLTADWYSGGEKIPGSYPTSLFSEAVTAAVTGAVTANSPQAHLTNSPLTTSTPNTHTDFTWPANQGPFSSLVVTYSGTGATNFAVSGLTTGTQYLSEVIDHGEWILPISSLVEPSGVRLTYNLPYGFTGAWGPVTFDVVASVAPQIVRPVFGPGDSGPTSLATANVGPSGSAVLAGTGSKTNTIRLWAAVLTVDNASAAADVAEINYGATPVLWCRAGAGKSNSAALSIPGGIALPVSLNPLQLVTTANTSAAASIAYSTDSA